MTTKKSLRKAIRHQRKALSKREQHQAMVEASIRLSRLPVITKAKHIAIYIANDGEISPSYFHHTHRYNKYFYIPKISNHREMRFDHFRAGKGTLNNEYGIMEMSRGKIRHLKEIDVIMLPLVAFDNAGNRVGMGGGFYDKALAFRRKNKWRTKPTLIGLAHDFQKVGSITTDAWDIPLDIAVTDKSTYYFSSK